VRFLLVLGLDLRLDTPSPIAASLGTSIVHNPPDQPEGRGKIERYFRTVRDQFLANLDPKQSLSLEELDDHLWTWIETAYHRAEHAGSIEEAHSLD
jgi:transposase